MRLKLLTLSIFTLCSLPLTTTATGVVLDSFEDYPVHQGLHGNNNTYMTWADTYSPERGEVSIQNHYTGTKSFYGTTTTNVKGTLVSTSTSDIQNITWYEYVEDYDGSGKRSAVTLTFDDGIGATSTVLERYILLCEDSNRHYYKLSDSLITDTCPSSRPSYIGYNHTREEGEWVKISAVLNTTTDTIYLRVDDGNFYDTKDMQGYTYLTDISLQPQGADIFYDDLTLFGELIPPPDFYIETEIIPLDYNGNQDTNAIECIATSEQTYNACGFDDRGYAILIYSDITTPFEDYYLEYWLKDANHEVIQPESGYHYSTWFSTTTQTFDSVLVLPNGTTTDDILLFELCVEEDTASGLGLVKCTHTVIGNGFASTTFPDFAKNVGFYDNTYDGVDLQSELGCDSIGITDVKKGIQCAFLWLFNPSANTKQQVSSLVNTFKYTKPLGYFYTIYSDFDEQVLQATSTDFVISMNMEDFGLPTTTNAFNITAMAQEAETLSPTLIDSVDKLIWAFFWFYLFFRILTGAYPLLGSEATTQANIYREKRKASDRAFRRRTWVQPVKR